MNPGKLRTDHPPAFPPNGDKMHRYALFVAVLMVGCGKAAPQASTKPKDLIADLVERIEPSVIVIDVLGANGKKIATGSGFIVRADGMAVTNFHVIEDAHSLKARFANGRESAVSGVLFMSEDKDLALIQLKDVKNIKPLNIASGLPRKGEFTMAFGAPQGLEFTATEGIVSAVRTEHQEGWPDVKAVIQTSTPISGGNSGGPLVNRDGEVIGINTFGKVSGQNLNFAVTSLELAEPLLTSKVIVATFPLIKPGKSVASKPDPELQLTETQKKSLIALVKQIEARKAELQRSKEQINGIRNKIKECVIADDLIAEHRAFDELKVKLAAHNAIVDSPVSLPSLDVARLTTGSMGPLRANFIQVIQVLSKDTGLFLGLVDGKVLQFKSFELSSIADGESFSVAKSIVFSVNGTVSYTAVNGSTNTVFQLEFLVDLAKTPGFDKIVDLSTPPLTAAEKIQRDVAVAAHQREREAKELKAEQEAEAARLASEAKAAAARMKEETAQKERDEAANRAKKKEKETKAANKLAIAKTFIEKKDEAAAKKWLSAVVKEFPDTAAGDEAKTLLRGFK